MFEQGELSNSDAWIQDPVSSCVALHWIGTDSWKFFLGSIAGNKCHCYSGYLQIKGRVGLESCGQIGNECGRGR